jgi:hypothetical protein
MGISPGKMGKLWVLAGTIVRPMVGQVGTDTISNLNENFVQGAGFENTSRSSLPRF